jgi:phage tail sheath gpL-like
VPTYFATPVWTRQGVVAGFVLAAPVFRGIPQAQADLQAISVGVPPSSFWDFEGSLAGAFNLGLQLNPLLSAFLIGSLVEWIGSAFTGNAFSVPMSNAANQAEALLKENLASWQGLAPASQTTVNQGVFLENFDTVWAAYVAACDAIIAGDPNGSDAKFALNASISDRQRGGKFDWFAAYRDPIANGATPGNTGSGAALGSIQFQFYNEDVTLENPTVNLTIDTGFQHWITIGSRTYSYYQQTADTAEMIAAALAELVNAASDPNAVASGTSGTYADGRVVLSPRANTGAEISCTASETNGTLLLIELTGQELIPELSKGVLFAQGQMYRPDAAPVLQAAPPDQVSYLYYSSVSGWYWSASGTPTVADDACVGWVATTADEIIAVSSRRIGTGAEAQIVPGGPVSAALINAGVAGTASGDTGAPTGAPSFGLTVYGGTEGNLLTAAAQLVAEGQLWLGDVTFPDGAENVAGVDALVALLYYVNELAGPAATLTAAMGATDTSLAASAALPVSAPKAVTFTFSAVTITVSGVEITIGPGYAHNITIGTAVYTYIQQTADTAEMIAVELAAAIQAAADLNATAAADGATVTLTPLESNGQTVTCSASDGNAPQTLTETQPSYYLIETSGGTSEIVEVQATDGSSVARGCLGSTAAELTAGSLIWPVQMMSRFYAVAGALYGTTAWPSSGAQGPNPLDIVPFRGLGLVALALWAVNEYGDSPQTVWAAAAANPLGGRVRGLCGGQLDLTVNGALGVQSTAAPVVTLGQAVSIATITAAVQNAPTGAALRVRLAIGGTAFMTLEIADGTTTATVDMGSSASTPGAATPATVDGIVLAAGQPITLDVLQVGSTYPGSDLAVSVKF